MSLTIRTISKSAASRAQKSRTEVVPCPCRCICSRRNMSESLGLSAIYALGITSLFLDDQAIKDMQFVKKIEAQRCLSLNP